MPRNMNKPHRTKLALSVSAAALVLTACGPVEIFGANPSTPTIEDTHHEPEIGEPGGPSKPSGPSLPLSPETTTAKNQQPTITFNGLGARYNSIFVYPGVSESTEDKNHNAEYLNGEVKQAVCGIEGRMISSVPPETPKQSAEWVEIPDKVGDQPEFVNLTYADLSVPFTDLPHC